MLGNESSIPARERPSVGAADEDVDRRRAMSRASGTGASTAPAQSPRPAPQQATLFDEEPSGVRAVGYRGQTACAAAGITYRQLDYWARTGLVEPSIRPAAGSGTQRLYSFTDVLVLKI